MIDGGPLRSEPRVYAVIGSLEHDVERLHRRVGEVWKDVVGLERPYAVARLIDGLVVSPLNGGLSRLIEKRTILFEQFDRASSFGTRFVPLDPHCIAGFLRRPVSVGVDRDALGNRLGGDESRDFFGGRSVEGLNFGAETVRMLHEDRQQVRAVDVDCVSCLAREFCGGVGLRERLTDQLEVFRSFESNPLGRRQLHRGFGHLSEGCAFAAVLQDATFDFDSTG